jgi:FkbM family methyltransferase
MGNFNIYKIKLIFLLNISNYCSFHGIFELVKAIFGKPKVLITFKNGNSIVVGREEIFTRLWFFFDKLTIDTRLKKLETAMNLKLFEVEGSKLLQFVYLNKNIQFSYNSEDDLLTILMALDVTFIQRKWRMIECKGNIIVDVGGNVGDTAIYFALNGAKKVITIEPFPSLFEILRNAVSYQNSDTILCINNTFEGFVEGHSFKANGNMSYPYFGSYFGPEDVLKRDDFSKTENASFNDLLNSDEIYNNYILKLSCAGCEYYLLKLSTVYLRHFKQIVVEYNYGYRSICNKLKESGFVVTHSKPIGIFGRNLQNHNVFLGMIIASRQN